MKKRDLVVTVIFIIFLVAPSIVYYFVKDKMDMTNYENRNLNQKPSFNLKTIQDFPKSYEAYFNDNLPFKNEIRRARSEFLYNTLKISSNERVIIGKDGWYFYNSKPAEGVSTIDDYRKTTKYKEEYMSAIKNDLLNTQKILNEKGIDFYIFVIPNKETVYADYLTSVVKRSDNKYSRTDQLVDYLDVDDLIISYPKNLLIDNRKNYDTYYKYDTHWNDYGAYVGIEDLMIKIDSSFQMPKAVFAMGKASGDLLPMNSSTHLSSEAPIMHSFLSGVSYSCESIDKVKKCSSNGLKEETIMIVGDSFRTATIPFFAKIYKNSLFMHNSDYEKDMIDKYKPDIIIFETVERYSFILGSSNLLLPE